MHMEFKTLGILFFLSTLVLAVVLVVLITIVLEKLLIRTLTEEYCPSCRGIFGDSIRATTTKRTPKWNGPVESPNVYPMTRNLFPWKVWTVTCPHCSHKTEFRNNGDYYIPS
ncbi:MAG: hypothetical protein ABIP97_06060 [Chthoniobacterales bacterium]